MQAWLALALQSRRDADTDAVSLRRRDREVARALPEHRSDRSRVRAWLDAVLSPSDRDLARRIEAGLRGLRLLLTVLGFVSGIGTAALVFSYDGSRPINVLPALAVFAVLPMLLLLAFVVSALPPNVIGAIPGVRDLQESLLALGGAWAGALLRLLPANARHALTEIFGEGRAHQRIFGRVQKWLLLGSLQRFAVAFHAGAILWFAARVFVTDLGFTWSATAEIVSAERVHALIRTLALPWSTLLPNAIPSLEDVQATQYFRLGAGTLGDASTDAIDPSLLSHWWTFLLAAMITYGLLPRLLAAALASWRFHVATVWTVEHAPAARDALDRMAAPSVDTRATETEVTAGIDDAAPTDGAGETTAPARALLVVWSRARSDHEGLKRTLNASIGLEVDGPVHEAGAGHSTDDDARTAADIAAIATADDVVVIVVRAWEPATMEAVDFVRTLRRTLGDERRLVVAGLRLDADDEGVAQWRHRMRAIGDPWLRTVALDPVDGGSR